MTSPRIHELVSKWRAEARQARERYGPFGASIADLAETHANELESAMRSADDEVFSLEEAHAWSGYSKSHLRAMIREGTIPQAGRKGKPGIRKGDLPIKPGHKPLPPDVIRRRKERRRRRRRR